MDTIWDGTLIKTLVIIFYSAAYIFLLHRVQSNESIILENSRCIMDFESLIIFR